MEQKNNNIDVIHAYERHSGIMQTVLDIDSVQFSYLRATVFSAFFGFAGIAFLLTRNILLFYKGIFILFVAFSVLLIITYFCTFNLFSHVQIICNLIAGAELEEKYKQLPKTFSKMLQMKRRYREIIFYIAFGFCPIITIGSHRTLL